MKKLLLIVGLGVLLCIALWWLAQGEKKATNAPERVEIESTTTSVVVDSSEPTHNQGAAIGEENLVMFNCSGGRTITAVFERDIVALTLSDGRQMTLRQARAASGISYLSNDSSVEFRGKGTEGMLIEKGSETYSGCAVQDR